MFKGQEGCSVWRSQDSASRINSYSTVHALLLSSSSSLLAAFNFSREAQDRSCPSTCRLSLLFSMRDEGEWQALEMVGCVPENTWSFRINKGGDFPWMSILPRYLRINHFSYSDNHGYILDWSSKFRYFLNIKQETSKHFCFGFGLHFGPNLVLESLLSLQLGLLMEAVW